MSRSRGPSVRALLPRWLVEYRRAWISGDFAGGLTLAVMLIPQGMAYAALADMPPITGLYAALVSLLVYALMGSSSHVSFGPFALVSLLTATALEPYAEAESPQMVALAGMLALIVGVIHLILGFVRAGALTDLISRPVIVGFTVGVALIIALSQTRDLLGVDVPRSERVFEAVSIAASAVPHTNVPTLIVGLSSLALLLLGRRFLPRVPMALVVCVAAILAVRLGGIDAWGVAAVGNVPGGLPPVSLPAVTGEDILVLIPSALVIALISYIGNISIAKTVATRSREIIWPNRELFASGTANIAASAVGGFPVSASFTRTAVVYDAGARTQLAGVLAAGAVMLTLWAFTGALAALPRAVLAAIVLLAVVGLLDRRSTRAIFRADRADAFVLVGTFLATLLLGAELGLLVGVGLNLSTHLGRRMRPPIVEIGRVPGTRLYRDVKRYETIEPDPNIELLRLDGELDFLGANHVATLLRRTGAREQCRAIVLEVGAVSTIDSTGLGALQDLVRYLKDHGVDLHLVGMRGAQRDRLAESGIWSELLEDRLHPGVAEALWSIGLHPKSRLIEPQPGETSTGSVY